MSFVLKEAIDARIVEITVSSKLTKEAYRAFIETTGVAIEKHGTIRVLFLMLGFNGWYAGSHWEDVASELKHLAKIERVAIVGESKWEDGASHFCRPFTTAMIMYFEQSKLEKAREWINGSLSEFIPLETSQAACLQSSCNVKSSE